MPRRARRRAARCWSATTARPTARSRSPSDNGARVVPAPIRGYGGALHGRHRGRPRQVRDHGRRRRLVRPVRTSARSSSELREGHDVVMGNRFKGGIAPGAMPPLHRYLGNPVLSWLGRRAVQAAQRRRLPLRHPRLLPGPHPRPRPVHAGHGVRLRAGGPGLAGRLLDRRGAHHAAARTAAAARRTCAPGATAGGTCASCSCSRPGTR